jgi:hypothetical protein
VKDIKKVDFAGIAITCLNRGVTQDEAKASAMATYGEHAVSVCSSDNVCLWGDL